jgi:hypothetical protein
LNLSPKSGRDTRARRRPLSHSQSTRPASAPRTIRAPSNSRWFPSSASGASTTSRIYPSRTAGRARPSPCASKSRRISTSTLTNPSLNFPGGWSKEFDRKAASGRSKLVSRVRHSSHK